MHWLLELKILGAGFRSGWLQELNECHLNLSSHVSWFYFPLFDFIPGRFSHMEAKRDTTTLGMDGSQVLGL